MSHYNVYTVKIANITEQMLRDAVQRLAKLEGLQVTDKITDYYDERHKIMIGLKGRGLAYGIGFNIVNGQLQICGDSYNSPSWSRIETAIQQHLIAQKIAVNTRAQHANARINFKTTQKAVLVEVEM